MRHSIPCLLVAIVATLPAAAQDQKDKPANPFEMQESEGGYGSMSMEGYGGMGGGYGGMGGYGGGMFDMRGGMGGMPAAADMGGGSPYGGAPHGDPPDPFRVGLARLLDMLPKAKSDEEKKQLLEYAREALTERYQQQLEHREREIRNLELRLAALRDEQQRRSDAAERIIELQMKSLELAAEGLLERDQVIHLSPRERRPRGPGAMGMSPYGSGSPYGASGSPHGAGGGSPYGVAPGAATHGGGESGGGYGEGSGATEGDAAPGGEDAQDAAATDEEQQPQ